MTSSLCAGLEAKQGIWGENGTMNSYFQQGSVGCREKKGRDEGKAVRAEQGTSESGQVLLHLPQDCSFLTGATKVWNTPQEEPSASY